MNQSIQINLNQIITNPIFHNASYFALIYSSKKESIIYSYYLRIILSITIHSNQYGLKSRNFKLHFINNELRLTNNMNIKLSF